MILRIRILLIIGFIVVCEVLNRVFWRECIFVLLVKLLLNLLMFVCLIKVEKKVLCSLGLILKIVVFFFVGILMFRVMMINDFI